MTEHGVALVERVIAAVEADPSGQILQFTDDDLALGPWVRTPRAPMPTEVLARAAFPSGRALPPSLRRWLAFDTWMLRRYGWLDKQYRLTPRTFGELCHDRYGGEWGGYFERAPMAARFDECFLLPGGADSCRVLVTSSVDEYGEYPVLALDVDDVPGADLMYPGFDVFLADNVGMVATSDDGEYSQLAEHPQFAARMAAHARQCFGGHLFEDCFGGSDED